MISSTVRCSVAVCCTVSVCSAFQCVAVCCSAVQHAYFLAYSYQGVQRDEFIYKTLRCCSVLQCGAARVFSCALLPRSEER